MECGVESDVLERAEAAWQAANDELVAAARLRRPVERRSGAPTLQIPDSMLALGAIGTAASELAVMMGELRKLITAAREATVGRDHIERSVEVEIMTVAWQTRRVRTLRVKYEERWRRPR